MRKAKASAWVFPLVLLALGALLFVLVGKGPWKQSPSPSSTSPTDRKSGGTETSYQTTEKTADDMGKSSFTEWSTSFPDDPYAQEDQADDIFLPRPFRPKPEHSIDDLFVEMPFMTDRNYVLIVIDGTTWAMKAEAVLKVADDFRLTREEKIDALTNYPPLVEVNPGDDVDELVQIAQQSSVPDLPETIIISRPIEAPSPQRLTYH